MGLGEDHQEIGDVGELFGAAGGELGDAACVGSPAGRTVAQVRIEEEAVVADGVEVLLVNVEEGDVGAGFGEETAEKRTHGAGTEDGDLHVGFFLTRGAALRLLRESGYGAVGAGVVNCVTGVGGVPDWGGAG